MKQLSFDEWKFKTDLLWLFHAAKCPAQPTLQNSNTFISNFSNSEKYPKHYEANTCMDDTDGSSIYFFRQEPNCSQKLSTAALLKFLQKCNLQNVVIFESTLTSKLRSVPAIAPCWTSSSVLDTVPAVAEEKMLCVRQKPPRSVNTQCITPTTPIQHN